MNISDLYRDEGYGGLVKLATAADVNPKYLYQCATGRRGLSRDMIARLLAADARLTLEAMFDMTQPARANG